jgi:tetratricopeptide (TPR) repeat protein
VRGATTSRAPGIQAVALFAALFALYAWGACRTIYVGDSGELVAAAATLGIPHPSGYPLYVLLGKLWITLLPMGSVAWRMSLFSAASAAAAAAVLYRVGRELRLTAPAALTAALTAALSPSFWGEANVQRVYALNALSLALATWAAVRWYRRPVTARGWLLLAFFLSGLGATNHTYMALFAGALGAFVLSTEPSLLRNPRRLACCAGAFALGLSPYLYLPLRSRMDPPLDWGNPETPARLLAVVLRRDFWDRAWLEGPADLLPIAADYLRSFATELTWAGAALAAVGVAVSLSRRPRLAGDLRSDGRASSAAPGGRDASRRLLVLLPLLAMAVNVLAMALHGSRSDLFLWHRYYVPSYLLAALLAGVGAQALADGLAQRASRSTDRTGAAAPAPLRTRQWPLLAAALPWALLLIPAVLLVSGFRRFDRSRYRVADDFSRALLASLPPGAHLAASDDNILFVLLYLHLVEGQRPDVDLILQGVGAAELPPLRFDPDRDPLFFTHHPNWSEPGLAVVPVGLAFRIARAGSPPAPVSLPRTELAGENDPRVPRDHLTQNLIGHFHSMLGVTLEGWDWPRAEAELRRAAAAAPDNDVLFYNLGLIYRRSGLLDRAAAAFERSRAINPRHLASPGRVRAADRLRELTVEQAAQEEVEALLVRDPSLAGLPPGSPAHHLRLADLLAARGFTTAAHGHRLRAEEAATRAAFE